MRRKARRWRLKESLLNDETVLQKAKSTLKEFFELNLNQGTDIKTVWDASKAVIRGFFIQQNAYPKKIREKKKKEIWEEMGRNEKELFNNPDSELIKQNIKMLQTQLSMIINQEIEWKNQVVRVCKQARQTASLAT